MKISAVIITLNEEKNIERCINSLQSIVDEIIVVDSFSSDKTEEICRAKGVNFIQQKWLGYAEQKNWGNKQAKYDWILSVDADEALSEELKNSILKIKETHVNDSIVFRMNRLTNYCGKWIKHCGWYPDAKIRLFNRKTIQWQGIEIHETLTINSNSKIIQLSGDLLHYSYYSIQDHIKQADKFTNLTALEAFKKGKQTNVFSIIVKSGWKFVRDYFFKYGFLDGYYGFLVCKISAFATFMKYAKLKQLHKQQNISH